MCLTSLILEDDAIFDPSACTNYFNTTCTNGVCDYAATWTVRGDVVDFKVSARVDLGQWVAIGFSDDTFMVSLSLSLSLGICII